MDISELRAAMPATDQRRNAARIEKKREAAATAAHDKRARELDVHRLKETIINELEKGTPLPFPLMAAVDAIAILTNDSDWKAACDAVLNTDYGNMLQGDLLHDDLQAALDAQSDRLEKWKDATRQNLTRAATNTAKVQKAISQALEQFDQAFPLTLDDLE